jgi:hypothetical protein
MNDRCDRHGPRQAETQRADPSTIRERLNWQADPDLHERMVPWGSLRRLVDYRSSASPANRPIAHVVSSAELPGSLSTPIAHPMHIPTPQRPIRTDHAHAVSIRTIGGEHPDDPLTR